MNNVSKHARATRVDLLLERRDGFAVLIIEDDGIGFEPNSQPEHKKIGLLSMRERAALVGGTIEIESAPGSGATLFVRVPFADSEKEKKK